ncbi:MAG: cytochrome c biogenesis protein [Leptospira sp.]|nr:cytochrome c biogenesis protein [Leptospira sp.]
MKVKLTSVFFDYTLGFLFLTIFPFSVYTSLYYPNVILEQGLSHRIFYFHVSVAWVALYGPVLSAFFAILYIARKNEFWDTLSYTSSKISLLFAIGVLFSGPIWAKSAWGVPWDWSDARLQSFFVLVVSLFSYFIFRNLVTNPVNKPLFSSYLSILCALNAVITWGAIRWIENPGNHPGSVLGKGGMDQDMRFAFWMNIIAYHLLFLMLFRLTYRFEKLKIAYDYLRDSAGE